MPSLSRIRGVFPVRREGEGDRSVEEVRVQVTLDEPGKSVVVEHFFLLNSI